MKMNGYLRFDGSTWPDPSDPNDAEWELRYKIAPMASTKLLAASYIAAYLALVLMTQKERNAVCRQIHAAAVREEKK